jgi:hypothetical protein
MTVVTEQQIVRWGKTERRGGQSGEYKCANRTPSPTWKRSNPSIAKEEKEGRAYRRKSDVGSLFYFLMSPQSFPKCSLRRWSTM